MNFWLMVNYANSSSDIGPASKNQAIQSLENIQKVRESTMHEIINESNVTQGYPKKKTSL